MQPAKPLQLPPAIAPSPSFQFQMNSPGVQFQRNSPTQQFAWQGAPSSFNMQSAGMQGYLNSPTAEFERGAPKAASDPMANQSPCSGCPDPNSGRPIDQRGSPSEDVPLPPPVTAPGRPPAGPLMTDLLYKGAMALIPDPVLWKLAAAVGKIKCQPSCMKVSALGEGDTSGLKVKPWQVNGEAAWEGIKCHK
jgi:hypothetical protein